MSQCSGGRERRPGVPGQTEFQSENPQNQNNQPDTVNIPVIPALERQEDHYEYEGFLEYRIKPCLRGEKV